MTWLFWVSQAVGLGVLCWLVYEVLTLIERWETKTEISERKGKE